MNPGLFDIQTDASIEKEDLYPGAEFRNEAGGSVTKTAGNGNTIIKVPFINEGDIWLLGRELEFQDSFIHQKGWVDLDGGTLTIAGDYVLSEGTLNLGANGGGTLSLGNDGTLTIEQSGTLTGGGIISGNVINKGRIDIGLSGVSVVSGLLSISGDYTQTSTGELKLRVLDSFGTQYDRLVIDGTATLSGHVWLVAETGFSPAQGDDFTILTYADRVGDFTSSTLPTLGSGLDWVKDLSDPLAYVFKVD